MNNTAGRACTSGVYLYNGCLCQFEIYHGPPTLSYALLSTAQRYDLEYRILPEDRPAGGHSAGSTARHHR